MKVDVDWRPCTSVNTTVTAKFPVWLGRVGVKVSEVPEILMKDRREGGSSEIDTAQPSGSEKGGRG
jgi:hypothetical protein